jgi:hypothetical protein
MRLSDLSYVVAYVVTAALAYHFFHLLWNMQFLFYFGYLVFAGATADWYFSETAANGEDKKVALAPVTRAVARTSRYHLGTVAITSLIIAIIQFIRATVAYIQRVCYAISLSLSLIPLLSLR